jgi:hypothetical protein
MKHYSFFNIHTYLIQKSVVKFHYKKIGKLGTGCKDTLVICNSAFMALVI